MAFVIWTISYGLYDTAYIWANQITSLLTIINAPIGMFLSLSVTMMQIHFLVGMDTLGKISHGKRSVWVRSGFLWVRFRSGQVDQVLFRFESGRFWGCWILTELFKVNIDNHYSADFQQFEIGHQDGWYTNNGNAQCVTLFVTPFSH